MEESRPADELGQFRADFEAAAHRASVRVVEYNDDNARIEVNGEKTRLGLRPLRNRWRALPPDKREDLLFDLLVAPLSDVFKSSENTFHEVREALRPRIGPPDVRDDLGLSLTPPSRPLIPGVLHVYAVVDEPATMWFVTDEHLERWGMTFEEVEYQATENLKQRTGPTHIERTDDFPVAQYLTYDSYDASRLLMIESAIGPIGPAGVVVAVPTKDHLFFAPVDGPQTQVALEVLLRINWKIFPQAAYPVTDQLLWFDGQKWWVLRWTKEGEHVEMDAPAEFLVAAGLKSGE